MIRCHPQDNFGTLPKNDNSYFTIDNKKWPHIMGRVSHSLSRIYKMLLWKKCFPPSIHFEKCFAPLPPSLKNALPHAHADILYASSIACPLSCQEGFVHRKDKPVEIFQDVWWVSLILSDRRHKIVDTCSAYS